MTVGFEIETAIAAPVDLVFDLSLDIDAHRASMSRSKERAIGGVMSGPIGLGEEVVWRATHFGVPFTMASRITELERPGRFVDEQVQGPFRRFRHEHRFEADGAGTSMTDTVTFDAPFGIVGRATEWAVLGRYLRHLIEVRNGYLKDEAERRHRSS